MKGKSNLNPNLKGLDQTLSGKYPYCLIGVQTTGDKENSEILRICAYYYVFSEKTGAYEMESSFDKLIKASDSAVTWALADTSGWNAFGGINVDDYKAGKNVLTPEEAKDAFMLFLKTLDMETLFIENGSEFCNRYLGKVGCADVLVAKFMTGHLLDFNRLVAEYFAENKITEAISLESVYKVLKGKDPSPFDLLGADKRLKNGVNQMVEQRGRDKGVLEGEIEAEINRLQDNYEKELTERGKAKYASSSTSEKVDVLKQIGAVNFQDIDDDLKNNTANTMLGKAVSAIRRGNAFIFTAVKTTGFNTTEQVRSGYPISMASFKTAPDGDGGLQQIKKENCLQCDIECRETEDGQRAFARAKQSALKAREQSADPNFKGRKSYDTFAEAEVNLDRYEKGLQSTARGNFPLMPQKEAAASYEKFLRDSNTTIVTAGVGGDNSDLPFGVDAFNGAVQISKSQEKGFIEITQFIKEVTLYCQETGKTNPLFDPDKLKGNMSLANVCKARPEGIVPSSASKTAGAIAMLFNDFYENYVKEHAKEPAIKNVLEKAHNQVKINAIMEEKAARQNGQRQMTGGVPGYRPAGQGSPAMQGGTQGNAYGSSGGVYVNPQQGGGMPTSAQGQRTMGSPQDVLSGLTGYKKVEPQNVPAQAPVHHGVQDVSSNIMESLSRTQAVMGKSEPQTKTPASGISRRSGLDSKPDSTFANPTQNRAIRTAGQRPPATATPAERRAMSAGDGHPLPSRGQREYGRGRDMSSNTDITSIVNAAVKAAVTEMMEPIKGLLDENKALVDTVQQLASMIIESQQKVLPSKAVDAAKEAQQKIELAEEIKEEEKYKVPEGISPEDTFPAEDPADIMDIEDMNDDLFEMLENEKPKKTDEPGKP